MRVLATYLFKMYRPGHSVFRYKTFLCLDEREAMVEADEWADCNGDSVINGLDVIRLRKMLNASDTGALNPYDGTVTLRNIPVSDEF